MALERLEKKLAEWLKDRDFYTGILVRPPTPAAGRLYTIMQISPSEIMRKPDYGGTLLSPQNVPQKMWDQKAKRWITVRPRTKKDLRKASQRPRLHDWVRAMTDEQTQTA
jgi:hypothetical protein